MEDKKKPSTYAQAGVDIRKEDLAVRGIANRIRKTFKFREGKIGGVLKDVGGYANLIDLGEFALAITTDGVGSKVLVAQELNKYNTVGIDLVAMNVNDLICLGAEPIAMVDYLATCTTDNKIMDEIAIGIYEGAEQAQIAVVGGETATLPDIICGIESKGFDLAGAAVGVVKKDKVITGEAIAPGDAVLGLSSSGIHSNGLTLARKVLPKTMWSKLLTPTRIYVKEIMTLINEFDVHGLANITGSSFIKLRRITDHGYRLDSMPEPDLIFKKVAEMGEVSDEEMYKTFNMGVGFCVITSPTEADKILEKYGREYKMTKIGEVIKEPKVVVVKDGAELVLS